MLKIALLPLLAATAFAAPKVAVTYQTIIADVNAINTGVQNFRTDLAAYNGGVLTQTPLLGDFAEIETANRKGYADANLASPFSAAGSTAIINDVIATVGKTIPASINELKAKKPLFQKAGEDGLIVSQLQVLLYDHDTFSAAVAKKLTADFGPAVAVVAEIHDAIQGGIDYFEA